MAKRTTTLSEQFGLTKTRRGLTRSYRGELEFIIMTADGKRVLNRIRDHNIVKIGAKEILAHRLAPSQVWDETGGTGSGAWVSSGVDPLEDFSAKYFLFGASFDASGAALDTTDTRYYTTDPVTQTTVPIPLDVGAANEGGLINAVPITEPGRPLKKVERVYFESSYQPAGTPLLQSDVRAMNNTLVLETTLQASEYNGFGLTSSDYFTITEVALAGGKQLDHTTCCELDPKSVFLQGQPNGDALLAYSKGDSATGTATVTIDPSMSSCLVQNGLSLLNPGDQIKLVPAPPGGTYSSDLPQVNDHYLVINVSTGGSDLTLDRTPVDSSYRPITGPVGVYRDSLRLFSHRILATPFKKSQDFMIVTRWRILFA